LNEFAEKYMEKRKGKVESIKDAVETMKDVLYFGSMLVETR